MKVGDAGGGDLAGSYPAPTVRAIQGQPVSNASPTASGQVLTWDGSQWQGAAVSTGFDLDDLIAVDGAGSGLDADRLDGLNSSEFARNPHAHAQYLERTGGTMTGVLSMSGNRIRGLAVATSAGDAVIFQQAVKSGDPAGGDLAGVYPNPTVRGLQGQPVEASTPAPGTVLTYIGTRWAPRAPPATGIQGRQRVLRNHVIAAGTTVLASAQCSFGKVALGGGYGSAESGIEVHDSFPGSSPDTWVVRFRNTTTNDNSVVVWATCANGSP